MRGEGKNKVEASPRLYKLWALLDVNQRPNDYESSALTAELRAHRYCIFFLVVASGLEPLTPTMSM